MGADGKRLLKHGQHLFWQGAGCDVEVFRLATQQQVAYAAANEVSLVAGGAQLGNNLCRRSLCCCGCHVYYYRKVSQSGLILAIESSCDETAAAVVERGQRIVSSVVASQIAIHAPYGGVVPELASREHLRNIVPVVRTALAKAGVGFADLDAIAVTEGPGLAGALLVGVAYAKSLAFALGKPLIAVNHLEGHIHAVLLAQGKTLDEPSRALALVVSGGHTHLYLTQHHGYRNVGATLDDAAGEAFDKVAKLLGLGYPGGPWIDALATHGDPTAVAFTLTQVKQKAHRPSSPKAAARFAFSFSGIKTAVLRFVQIHDLYPSIDRRRAALAALPLAVPADALPLCDARTLGLIASFQRAVVDDLKRKTFQAAEALGAESILVSGGVAANRELRARFAAEADRRGLPIAFPTVALSTDNAAMIGAAAWPKFLSGEFAPLDLTAEPRLALGVKA
jgi:N6-L-threonylcarbamoyladenine synthase